MVACSTDVTCLAGKAQNVHYIVLHGLQDDKMKKSANKLDSHMPPLKFSMLHLVVPPLCQCPLLFLVPESWSHLRLFIHLATLKPPVHSSSFLQVHRSKHSNSSPPLSYIASILCPPLRIVSYLVINDLFNL